MGKQRINSAMLILKVKSIKVKRPAKKEALNIMMIINDLKILNWFHNIENLEQYQKELTNKMKTKVKPHFKKKAHFFSDRILFEQWWRWKYFPANNFELLAMKVDKNFGKFSSFLILDEFNCLVNRVSIYTKLKNDKGKNRN